MVYYCIQFYIFFSYLQHNEHLRFLPLYNEMLETPTLMSRLIYLTILGAHEHGVCLRSIMASTFSTVTSYGEFLWWGYV